ncbi:hypothetical protein ACT8ZV_08190 [Nocardioides sp. MAHUQ-72]|uniref:hypothetical protein n=1 Tax=unclassified Nocardioides TaxID=2615069 RepID=UPI003609F8DB
MDIRDEIDRSFGSGPEPGPVTALVSEGRRALRRRRLVTGAAAAAVVVAIGGTTALATAGGGHPQGAPVAGEPKATTTTGSPTPSPTTAPERLAVVTDKRAALMGMDVSLQPDGTLHVAPGVKVVRVVDNPYHRKAPSISAAVVYRLNGQTYWYAGYVDKLKGGGSASQQAMTELGFRDWIDEQAPIQGSERGGDPGSDVTEWPGQVTMQLVRFDGDSERLQPLDAVTMVQQRPHPAVGESFAGPDDRTAVAEVEFEGERYYVLARRSAGAPAQYIAVSAADGGATLDAFLDLARQRYAEGGGGLL